MNAVIALAGSTVVAIAAFAGFWLVVCVVAIFIAPAPPRTAISPAARAAIYKRDGAACLKCGATNELVIDHIKPVARGGRSEIGNYQTLCASCNGEKGTLHIDYRRSKTVPYISSIFDDEGDDRFGRVTRSVVRHEAWRHR